MMNPTTGSVSITGHLVFERNRILDPRANQNLAQQKSELIKLLMKFENQNRMSK